MGRKELLWLMVGVIAVVLWLVFCVLYTVPYIFSPQYEAKEVAYGNSECTDGGPRRNPGDSGGLDSLGKVHRERRGE